MRSAVIRRGSAADGDAIGRIFIRARDAMTYLPRIPDADRPRIGGWIAARHQVWVVEDRGVLMGFAGVSPGWLDHLYIDPEFHGGGLGSMLLDHVKSLERRAVSLWVFQKNAGARRFYERHDFRLEKLTDGSGNMEREPDALYVWRASKSAGQTTPPS